jgi:CARDB
MRRVLLIAALALLGLPAAADAASVKLLACVPALEPADRSATFEARMQPADGSARMQLRFTLQVKHGDLPGWQRIVAGGLDRWLTSYPDVRRYSYAKTVRNLSAPASYRMVVRFRWLGDADGEVLERSRATSRICRQPDMRPDLAATAIVPVAGGYEVELHNSGRSDAGPFAVAFAVGDQALAPLAVEGLPAGERRVVSFTAPPCLPSAPLTATADADGAVDERDESDNALVAACLP